MSKKYLMILLLLPFLSGCVRQSPCRVVTQVHVTSATQQYRYDTPSKVRKFVLYLRSLETWGPAELDALEGEEYRIRVTFSDGGSKEYRIRNKQCLSVNNSRWLKIYEESGQTLPLLLGAIPPDG